ncbi:hypothetical protein SK128_026466 [Halocaridina rubra]|uniref:Uncharacterized protein n=1 Tax=Halocaridina rubra TaxID=373956 RepID=A0AAN8XEA6_HALRR
MREEVRWLIGPAVILTLVGTLMLYEHSHQVLQNSKERIHRIVSLTELQKDLVDLAGKVTNLENATVFTKQQMTLLKRLAWRAEKHFNEEAVFRKMCGTFAPCNDPSGTVISDTTPTVNARVIE